MEGVHPGSELMEWQGRFAFELPISLYARHDALAPVLPAVIIRVIEVDAVFALWIFGNPLDRYRMEP